MARVKSENKIALAVATSGIAASLLDGGKTVHSTFKVPLNVDADTTCGIKINSELAELIRNTQLFIWDEAVMAHKHVFSTVDRSFRDITQNGSFFGNKLMVFGGDFRQILPVVPKGILYYNQQFKKQYNYYSIINNHI